MDGDSKTEHRSGALCSSPNSHAFSSDEGSHRPIMVLKKIKKILGNKKKQKPSVSLCWIPVNSWVVNAMLHCAFSQSHSLYLTLPTPNRCPGAHLSALPEQRVETRVWSRVRECRVFHFGQVGEAVARLREMCVGMATVGLRHRGGGWWGGGGSVRFKAGRMKTKLPVYLFKNNSTNYLSLLLRHGTTHFPDFVYYCW